MERLKTIKLEKENIWEKEELEMRDKTTALRTEKEKLKHEMGPLVNQEQNLKSQIENA